jgi:DnaJ-class molecular chaperone
MNVIKMEIVKCNTCYGTGRNLEKDCKCNECNIINTCNDCNGKGEIKIVRSSKKN